MLVNCRRIEISQVLIILLNNSFDAICKRKERWVKVEAKDLGDATEISVTDSGDGIPLEIQEKILTPFYTTKEVGEGTGLGLSIGKGIIDGHSGRFYIDNNSPNTKFIIELKK